MGNIRLHCQSKCRVETKLKKVQTIKDIAKKYVRYIIIKYIHISKDNLKYNRKM